jgi:hypothetical protein
MNTYFADILARDRMNSMVSSATAARRAKAARLARREARHRSS